MYILPGSCVMTLNTQFWLIQELVGSEVWRKRKGDSQEKEAMYLILIVMLRKSVFIRTLDVPIYKLIRSIQMGEQLYDKRGRGCSSMEIRVLGIIDGASRPHGENKIITSDFNRGKVKSLIKGHSIPLGCVKTKIK